MSAKTFDKPEFRISGDRAMLVEYGQAIDPAINRRVRAAFMGLGDQAPAWLVEALPTYRSLLIFYDPDLIDPEGVEAFILDLEDKLTGIEIPPPRTTEIPVCYGGDLGPDLDFVAQAHDIDAEEVIRIHSQPAYQIYMIGFTPGFPFLGGLPEALHTPRLETPRLAVPAGSVGIANAQTGIYPITSPGGWQLIGRTPLSIFDPDRADPFLLRAGDLLKFKPIDRREYDDLLAEQGK